MSRATSGVFVAALFLCAVTAFSADRNGSAGVRAQLDRPLPPAVLVDFSKGVSLKDALEFVRDVSNTSFHVNWKAIEAAGVTSDTQVNFRLRNVSLRKLLTMILSEAGGNEDKLAFYVDEGIIEITTRELADSLVYTIVYPVQDLLIRPADQDPGLMQGSMMGMMMGGGGMGGMGGGYGGGGYGGGGGRWGDDGWLWRNGNDGRYGWNGYDGRLRRHGRHGRRRRPGFQEDW